MAADEFGNYLAGYYAGYSGKRGIYWGMRTGGVLWAALSNLGEPGYELITGDEIDVEHWTDSDSVPAINAGFEDGLRDRQKGR